MHDAEDVKSADGLMGTMTAPCHRGDDFSIRKGGTFCSANITSNKKLIIET